MFRYLLCLLMLLSVLPAQAKLGPVTVNQSGQITYPPGFAATNLLVTNTDARLSDARVPLPHSVALVTNLGTVAVLQSDPLYLAIITNMVSTNASLVITNLGGGTWGLTVGDSIYGATNLMTPRAWVEGFSNAPASWNDNEHTIDITMPDGTVGQMFEEVYTVVRNTTGSTIANGKAVRASYANGYYSGAVLASCTDSLDNVMSVIGLATQDITNNAIGKITLIGNVNGLDTTGFEEGSNLWLSASPGELTMTRPTSAGQRSVFVGTCLRRNSNVGRISVLVRFLPLPEDIGLTNLFAYQTAIASNMTAVAVTNGSTITTTLGAGAGGGGTLNHGSMTNLNGDVDYQHISTSRVSLIDSAVQDSATMVNGQRYVRALTNQSPDQYGWVGFNASELGVVPEDAPNDGLTYGRRYGVGGYEWAAVVTNASWSNDYYLASNPSNYVDAAVTNGLATTGYVAAAVGAYIPTSSIPLFATSNQGALAETALQPASTNGFDGRYVTGTVVRTDDRAWTNKQDRLNYNPPEDFVVEDGLLYAYVGTGLSIRIPPYIGNLRVTSIPAGVFSLSAGDPVATNIVLPDTVVSIDQYAFVGNTHVTSVELGENVTNVSDSSFGNCDSLLGVYYRGNAPALAGAGTPFFPTSQSHATNYYLSGMTGFGTNFGGRPTAIWGPRVAASIVTGATTNAPDQYGNVVLDVASIAAAGGVTGTPWTAQGYVSAVTASNTAAALDAVKLNTNGNGSALTGITPSQINAVSNSASSIAAAGGVISGVVEGVTGSVANGILNISEDVSSNLLGLCANGTCSIPYNARQTSDNQQFWITQTNNVVFSMPLNNWDTNKAWAVVLDINSAGFSTTWEPSTMKTNLMSSFSTSAVNHMIWGRGKGQTNFVGTGYAW